ncbi:hypothetical protein DL768_000822 [Monosporascus sp. mg162]|nr:hypothetical protein DL768_000822 [Monosporascus sp. mg162]
MTKRAVRQALVQRALYIISIICHVLHSQPDPDQTDDQAFEVFCGCLSMLDILEVWDVERHLMAFRPETRLRSSANPGSRRVKHREEGLTASVAHGAQHLITPTSSERARRRMNLGIAT